MLSYESEQWAELNQEPAGGLMVELYPRQDGRPWCLPLEQVLLALELARQRLVGYPSAQADA